MNLHEYQAKELLQQFDLPLLKGKAYINNLETIEPPMPLEPPVTIAVFPSTENKLLIVSLSMKLCVCSFVKRGCNVQEFRLNLY